MQKIFFAVLATAILAGGASFFGGMKYAQNQAQADRQQRMQQFGGTGNGFRNGAQGNRSAGGFASGEILSKDDKSITIKMRDGGSKIIFYSGVTEIGKFVTGAVSDLAVGKTVSVNGTANSDGSITAQSMQVRPAMPAPAQ